MEVYKKTYKFLREFDELYEIEIQKMYQALHDGGFHMAGSEEHLFQQLWFESNDFYFFGACFIYKQILEDEIKEQNKQGVYFHFCKFETYEKTYNARLSEFLKKYEDADSIYFIREELNKYSKRIEDTLPFKNLDETDILQPLEFSRSKTLQYLKDKAKEIGYNVEFEYDDFEWVLSYKINQLEDYTLKKYNSDDSDKYISNIEWKGSQTELIELLKALIENNTIQAESQKDVFNQFAKFLNVEINNPDKLINDIKKRSNGSETLFLDKLKKTLYNYIQK